MLEDAPARARHRGKQGVKALPAVDDRAVVFVGHEHDRDQRIGTQEVRALLEQLRVGAIEQRLPEAADARVDPDRGVRVGIDEEAVDGLERGFVAAAVLPHAFDHVCERCGDRGGGGEAPGMAGL